MQHFPLLECCPSPGSNVVVHAMSDRNVLLCILETCGGFLHGEAAFFLVSWGGDATVVACAGRLFRHVARVVCFWCGNQHWEFAQVYSRIFARDGHLGTYRPVEPGDRALYLTCCLRDLMLVTDPRIHRDTHRWCQQYELWIRYHRGCEHGPHFETGSDSS